MPVWLSKLILAAVLAVLLGSVLILFLISSTPQLDLDPSLTVIGAATPVKLRVADPHGVRRLTAYLDQNLSRYTVYDSSSPARRFLFWTAKQQPKDYSFVAGTKNAPGLKDGKARLIVEAVSNDLRGYRSQAKELVLVTRPPAIAADGAQHYINQGGSEMVRFTPTGLWSRPASRVANYTFRSFPVPGRRDGALFVIRLSMGSAQTARCPSSTRETRRA